MSDFSNLKRLFVLKLGFFAFSLKLSRLKKMFYLTSNAVMLGVFFFFLSLFFFFFPEKDPTDKHKDLSLNSANKVFLGRRAEPHRLNHMGWTEVG